MTIIVIIEGQINLFILSKLNRDLQTTHQNDIWIISVALVLAIGFIYIFFPLIATFTQFLVLIAMVQLSLMSISAIFRKGIHIAISLSIIISNILSVSGIFFGLMLYDYLWIMGFVYISKILFVEGVLKTLKSLNK